MKQLESGQNLLPVTVLGLCALSVFGIIVVPIDPPSDHLGIGLLLVASAVRVNGYRLVAVHRLAATANIGVNE